MSCRNFLGPSVGRSLGSVHLGSKEAVLLCVCGHRGDSKAEVKTAEISRLPQPPQRLWSSWLPLSSGDCGLQRARVASIAPGGDSCGHNSPSGGGDPKNPDITSEVKFAKASSFLCSS